MEELLSRIIADGIIGILDRYAEPLMKGIVQKFKEDWDKFRVDFNLAFKTYSSNAFQKYSYIKTILYRTEPRYIYDFFEIPILKKNSNSYIKADNSKKITDVSHFVLVQGTGGIGKSTLLKHLFISELKQKDLIPILIELKDVNDNEGNYTIEETIFKRLTDLGTSLSEDCLRYALKSGCFLFLMDGCDEIHSDKRNSFLRKLVSFCDAYSKNYFILSSRPYSDFVEWQRFTVLTTCPLSKEQAISLVSRVDFDQYIKGKFIKELDSSLYEKHSSFASNPLLLNIMLLTFDNFAEIPEKLHLFYENAFETLYSKHDATKAGYRRELRSKLPNDSFKKVFACFCFTTYYKGQLEFTKQEMYDFLNDSKKTGIDFCVEHYIYDLENSLCVIYQEGFAYKFTHRSFQEYFTAFFLKELSDELLRGIALKLVERDVIRATDDEVFKMLHDMAQDKFERGIIKPLLDKLDSEYQNRDKFDYLFTCLIGYISITLSESGNIPIIASTMVADDYKLFLYMLSGKYIRYSNNDFTESNRTTIELLEYLKKSKRFRINQGISAETVLKDPISNQLLRRTITGMHVLYLADSFRNQIFDKSRKFEMDISRLLLSE